MTLKEQILHDIKEAMKTKDTQKRDALRLLSSAIKQIEVDDRKTLQDSDIIKIIQKQVKQRMDSIAQYKQANREDLIKKEEYELNIYKNYLPKQLSDKELEEKIKTIINDVQAISLKDMGKVMNSATQKLQGLADGKRISEMVKKLLS